MLFFPCAVVFNACRFPFVFFASGCLMKTGYVQREDEFPKRSFRKTWWSMSSLVEFLGLKRSVGALLIMVVLLGLGERMAERFLPLYLLALGGGALAVGLLNGLSNLLGALYALPGGWASQRFGYKRALLFFNLMSMAGYLIVIVYPSWMATLAGAALFLCWSAISLPASMDLISSALPKGKRTMGVSMHSLVRRVPMALGPLVGGLLIDLFGIEQGVRLAFGAALFVALVALAMQQRLIEEPPRKESPTDSMFSAFKWISPDLRCLLASDILVRFCEQIPYAFVIVWCVTMNHITSLQFGFLTAIEMGTAMLVYIPVAFFADKAGKKPFVVATFCFFTLFPIVLLFSHDFFTMVIAFVIRGLKEFGEPTRKSLILDLAPENRKAAVFGAYYLLRDTVVSLAAFGGAFLWDRDLMGRLLGIFGLKGDLSAFCSPEVNLIVAATFGLAGTLLLAFFGRDVQQPSRQAKEG